MIGSLQSLKFPLCGAFVVLGLFITACSQASSDEESWKQKYAPFKIEKPVYPEAFVIEGVVDQEMFDRLDAFEGTEAVYRSAEPLESGYLPEDYQMMSGLISRLSKLDRVIIDDHCTVFCAPYLFLTLDNVYVDKNAVIGFSAFNSVDAEYFRRSEQMKNADYDTYIVPIAASEAAYLDSWGVDVDFIMKINSISQYKCISTPIYYNDLGPEKQTYALPSRRSNYSYWTTDSQALALLNPNAEIEEGYDVVPISEKLQMHRRGGIPYHYTTELKVEDYMDESFSLPICED